MSETSLGRIGFVGLGVMGLPMARNLLTAGHPMIVHTRTRSRAVEVLDAGAAWGNTPAEVAEAARITITMLPDGPDVQTVCVGPKGLFSSSRPGSVWIDMSTIAPDVARDLAEEAQRRGIRALDAPVSGGQRGAIEGTLSIMVGGDADTLGEVRPILECLGTTIVPIGPHGAGQTAKACNQLVVGATIGAVAEALALAGRAGADPELVRGALLGGLAQSRVLDVHGRRMLDRTFDPGFRISLHAKDLDIVLRTAASSGAIVPLAEIVSRLMERLMTDGDGNLDHAALIRAYERAD